eukprot:1582148-Prymnesium_polylepis.1
MHHGHCWRVEPMHWGQRQAEAEHAGARGATNWSSLPQPRASTDDDTEQSVVITDLSRSWYMRGFLRSVGRRFAQSAPFSAYFSDAAARNGQIPVRSAARGGQWAKVTGFQGLNCESALTVRKNFAPKSGA